MLSLLQRVNTLQLIGVKDMDKKKREGQKVLLFFIYLFIYELLQKILQYHL